MIVIVIIGILTSFAFPRYIRLVEKGRSAEARHVLGMIRMAENAFYFENNCFTNDFVTLNLNDVPTSCAANYYFSYFFTSISCNGFVVNATRCTAGSGGKEPQSPVNYFLSIDQNGQLAGTGGFL